ncbi:MAG: polyferredoxin [Planctomycetota bacterium]|jgi:polyferredoxin
MAIGKVREKVLFGIGKARSKLHRYTWWRWIIGTAFTIGVALLPLLDIMRFDFWSGRHMVMGEQVGLVEAAKAFAFPFLGLNILIVVVSRFFGRYLCGYMCPYGSLARLAEWFRWREGTGKTRVMRISSLIAVAILLTLIVFIFWIDWRVFIEGSNLAIGISVGLIVVGTALISGTLDRVGLTFCHDWCPSGVYFAILGPKTSNGVEFSNPDACIECDICDKVCPIDLLPREMEFEDEEHERSGSGLYPDGMTNHALCIRCGDCVVACEAMTSRFDTSTPLRMGFLPPEDERHNPKTVSEEEHATH